MQCARRQRCAVKETWNSAIADKPRDAFVQMQQRGRNALRHVITPKFGRYVKGCRTPKLGIAWMEGVTDPINTPLPTRVTGRICFVVRSNGTSVTKICLKSLASHLPHLKVTQGHRNQRFNRLTFHIATTFLSRIYRFRNKRRFLSYKLQVFHTPVYRLFKAPHAYTLSGFSWKFWRYITV